MYYIRLNVLLHNAIVKAIEGSAVIFACDAEMKVPIAGVSTLFME